MKNLKTLVLTSMKNKSRVGMWLTYLFIYPEAYILKFTPKTNKD